ncbi:hypothetical protein J6590_049299 [Homalodisca vitripennis]|nr:hypothetical protein J6590_049299 [Homalodisca vitripennis]
MKARLRTAIEEMMLLVLTRGYSHSSLIEISRVQVTGRFHQTEITAKVRGGISLSLSLSLSLSPSPPLSLSLSTSLSLSLSLSLSPSPLSPPPSLPPSLSLFPSCSLKRCYSQCVITKAKIKVKARVNIVVNCICISSSSYDFKYYFILKPVYLRTPGRTPQPSRDATVAVTCSVCER